MLLFKMEVYLSRLILKTIAANIVLVILYAVIYSKLLETFQILNRLKSCLYWKIKYG